MSTDPKSRREPIFLAQPAIIEADDAKEKLAGSLAAQVVEFVKAERARLGLPALKV